jgi:phosphonopyruvate decarboxylase
MDGSGRPFALVMRKGTVAPQALRSRPPEVAERWIEPDLGATVAAADRPTRSAVLQAVIDATPPEEAAVIATTGYTGRELYALDDRPNQLYMVGSMGCAPSLALGLSLVRPDLRVVVADGDGAALMRMGNFATVGACGGDGFAHVLLDNGRHESTGGQATVSHSVRFAAVAAACGYAQAVEAAGPAEVAALVASRGGPRLAHVRTRPGVPEGLPRPSVTPVEVRTRFMRQFGFPAPWRDRP